MTLIKPVPVLEVRELRTVLSTDDGAFAAVDGVSISVDAGRTLAIVGESGCGKSVTSLSIMGLLPSPPGRIESGSIRFEGHELAGAPARAMQDLRGNAMAMIFQEPKALLNPVFTIGERIVEVALRQRAMIAMALACAPHLLIADEPTTALDVTIQAQILAPMRTLQADTRTAIILTTHDLGVVAEVADEVVVMYAGRVVERAPVQAWFEAPQQPYGGVRSARSRAWTASASGLRRSRGRCSAHCIGHRAAALPGAVRLPFCSGCRSSCSATACARRSTRASVGRIQ